MSAPRPPVGNELRPGMVTPAGHVLTLDELTVRHGELMQAPAQPPGTWCYYPWPNGRDPAGGCHSTYIEPRAEWQAVFDRWLPGYSWPNEPSLDTLEPLLMAAPFNMSPSDFNHHHNIKRVVWMLENAIAEPNREQPNTHDSTIVASPTLRGDCPTDGQSRLWAALDGRCLGAEELAGEGELDSSDDTVRHWVMQLRNAGRDIKTRGGGGYYRPDAPPEEWAV